MKSFYKAAYFYLNSISIMIKLLKLHVFHCNRYHNFTSEIIVTCSFFKKVDNHRIFCISIVVRFIYFFTIIAIKHKKTRFFIIRFSYLVIFLHFLLICKAFPLYLIYITHYYKCFRINISDDMI